MKILLDGITCQKIISFHIGIHNHLHILFLQGFLFTYDTSTSFDPTNNMKLLNTNYKPKSSNLYPLYTWRKKRDEYLTTFIHVHLFPMYQTNHQVPLITFHPSMDRFFIIGNLRFGQVYILDLLLLLTWNSYLNYPTISLTITTFFSHLHTNIFNTLCIV